MQSPAALPTNPNPLPNLSQQHSPSPSLNIPQPQEVPVLLAASTTGCSLSSNIFWPANSTDTLLTGPHHFPNVHRQSNLHTTAPFPSLGQLPHSDPPCSSKGPQPEQRPAQSTTVQPSPSLSLNVKQTRT
jgi:hypothetical protein